MAERRSNSALENVVAEETLAHRSLVESVGSQLENATPGSPRRRLYDELMRGTTLREAISSIPGLDLGPNPGRTAALAKAYADNRRVFETVANGTSVAPNSVAGGRFMAVRVVSNDDVRRSLTELGNRQSANQYLNAVQMDAVNQEKSRINEGLGRYSSQLATMERNGEKHSEDYRTVLTQYSNLKTQVVETPAADIALAKRQANEEVRQTLEEGREHGGAYDVDQLKRQATDGMHQDRGLMGEVRPAEGEHFGGWERNEDVILKGDHEAWIAMSADNQHSKEFLNQRLEGGQDLGYYEFMAQNHQAALDQPIREAPKYGLVRREFGLVEREAGLDQREAGLVKRDPMAPGAVDIFDWPGQNTFAEGTGVAPSSMPTSTPLVVTSDHADFDIHADEAMRQHRAMQARVLTSLGFSAVTGAVSFMEASTRWAANPDGGATAYAFSNAMLGLNAMNGSVQTWFQSKDAKERAFGTLIQEQKEAQGGAARQFQTKALGAISQLEAIHPPVKHLHAAEMEARAALRPQLDKDWAAFQTQNSSALYKDLFTQASHSQNKDLAKEAMNGLGAIEKADKAGKPFTAADFHLITADKGWNIPGLGAGSTGDVKDRLSSEGGEAALDGKAHLVSIERNYFDAKRMSWEQNWLATQGQSTLLRKFQEQPGVTPAGIDQLQIGTDREGHPLLVDKTEVLEAFGQKWAVERSLIEENVRLVDKRPELAAAMRHHGLDAASVLESVYTNQSSPSSGSTRVADAMRKMFETEQGRALAPAGWNRDAQRNVGVADLGNGQYAAVLTGHDSAGKTTGSRVVLFHTTQDPLGQSVVGIAGVSDLSKDEMAHLGARTPMNMNPLSPSDLGQKLTARLKPGVEMKGLKDPNNLTSLSRALNQASTADGFTKLTTAPAHASILEFPRPSHISHLDPKARLQSGMDVAVNDASQLVHRGIKQMRDLHGISPVAWLKRLDSNRKHGEARREFDATRGAFDGVHVRERAKSDLFTNLMHRHSGPNDAGPVVVDPAELAPLARP